MTTHRKLKGAPVAVDPGRRLFGVCQVGLGYEPIWECGNGLRPKTVDLRIDCGDNTPWVAR